MPEVHHHSLTFRPFDPVELSAIRAVARLDRSLESLTVSVVRVQFLRATMGAALGARGERGLAHDRGVPALPARFLAGRR